MTPGLPLTFSFTRSCCGGVDSHRGFTTAVPGLIATPSVPQPCQHCGAGAYSPRGWYVTHYLTGATVLPCGDPETAQMLAVEVQALAPSIDWTAGVDSVREWMTAELKEFIRGHGLKPDPSDLEPINV